MAQPAAVLSVLVTANTTQATTGLTKLNTQLGATSKSANQAMLSVKSLAKGAALGAVTVAATKAVGSFVDFDKSMRNVNSIAKLSEDRFDSLSKRVLKLAGPTAQAPKTLADGLYQLVSSGFKANDAVKVLEKSAVAATAGLTDTATATQVIAASLNAYGLAAEDAGHVSDVLFKTVDRGVLSFADLAQQLGPVLPSARGLAVSLEQVGAAMATLTKQGFPAAEAATAIDATLRSLLKPSQALKQAFKELGVEGGEQLIQKYGSLQKALVVLRGTTDGSGTAFRKLFNEQRAGRGVMALTGDQAKAAAEDLRQMGKASGSTAKAFKEQSKSAAVQWQKLKAELEAFAASVGAVLFPILLRTIRILKVFGGYATTLTDGPLARLIEVFLAFGNPITRFIGLIRILTAVIKTLSRWFGSVAQTGRKLAGTVADTLAPAFEVLKDVVSVALTPLRKVYGILKDIAGIAGKVVGVLGDVGGVVGKIPGIGDPKGWREKMQALVQSNLGQMPGGTFKGGTYKWANQIAGMFGLHVSGGYRDPAHNAAVGGVPGSLHTHGSMSNPGAIDMVGPTSQMNQAASWARSHIPGIQEVLVHDAGSGLHLHLGFFAKGGKVQQSGLQVVGERGPEIVSMPVGTEVFSHSKSRSMAARMGGALPGFAGGGTVLSGLNRVFPAGSLKNPGPALTERQVRAVAEGWGGLTPARALQAAQVSRGESAGFHPGIIGYDPGGTLGIGLWQITRGVQGALGKQWIDSRGGDYGMRNPKNNAEVMSLMSGKGASWSQWFGTKYLQPLQQGVQSVLGQAAKVPERMATIIGGGKKKQPNKAPRYFGIGKGGVLDAFMTAASDRQNMMTALAALNDVEGDRSTLLDDYAVAKDAIQVWESWLGVAQLNKYQAGITTAATNLKSARDWMADLLKTPEVDNSAQLARDAERAGLLEQLLREANQRLGVSQAQYGALKYGGQFAEGGVIPGPIGSPRVIVAHGGETVTPAGSGGVQVIINGDIINTPKGKQPVDIRDIRTRQRALPGRGGGG